MKLPNRLLNESPRWLISQRRYREANEVVESWFHGEDTSDANIYVEVNKLRAYAVNNGETLDEK